MRRSLVALPIAIVIGGAAAAAFGVFSSSAPSPSHTVVAGSTAATMRMTTTTGAGSKTSTVVETHRPVVRVKIENFAFQPARIVVSPGTKVVWTNDDSDPHTVTTDQPGFSSQALDTGSRFTEMVTHAGTITYHCTIHPFMHGAVVVQ